MNELTDEEKKTVLDDFIEWSGGHHPRECGPEEVVSYVQAGMAWSLPSSAVKSFLESERLTAIGEDLVKGDE